jgi:tetratricopeptide (TPR) repeat protein
LAESLGDQRRLGRVLATMSSALFPLGRHEQAVDAGRQALRIAMEIGLEDDPHVQAESRRSIAAASHALGDYRQATRVLRENIALCEGRVGQGPDHFTYWAYWGAVSRTWLAYCLAEQGDFAEAIECARVGVANTERVGHPYLHMITLHGLAFAHLLRGDHRVAIPLFERGLAMSRDNGIMLWDADFACALGNAYMLAGRTAEAVPFMERSIQEQQSLGQEGQLAFWMTWLCEAYLDLGNQADAKRLTSQALDLARERGQRGVQALCHRFEAERTMCGDPFDPKAAEQQYQEALTIATELGMRPLIAHCHLGLGKLHRRTGKREQAREHLSTTAAMYREMGMTYWLQQAEVEMKGLA